MQITKRVGDGAHENIDKEREKELKLKTLGDPSPGLGKKSQRVVPTMLGLS